MSQVRIEYAYDVSTASSEQIDVTDLGASFVATGQMFPEANLLIKCTTIYRSSLFV